MAGGMAGYASEGPSDVARPKDSTIAQLIESLKSMATEVRNTNGIVADTLSGGQPQAEQTKELHSNSVMAQLGEIRSIIRDAIINAQRSQKALGL